MPRTSQALFSGLTFLTPGGARSRNSGTSRRFWPFGHVEPEVRIVKTKSTWKSVEILDETIETPVENFT